MEAHRGWTGKEGGIRHWVLGPVKQQRSGADYTQPQPCFHNLALTRRMVATGLLDIPPEIHLQIAEIVGTNQALKALSLTSCSLRSIAQSVLFKKFRIDLKRQLKGSIDDLLANPRVCAAIRYLELRGRGRNSMESPYGEEEKLSLIKKLLPEMVGLRAVWIHRVNLSKGFMDAFLETAAKIPLQVNLYDNTHPPVIGPASDTPLRIYCLQLVSRTTDPPIGFYQSTLRASAATLKKLCVVAGGDVFVKLVDIDLPFLHHLDIIISPENEVSRTGAAAFISAQKTVRRLCLTCNVGTLPSLPPDALPDLRELNTSTELVNQLVPGRPVEAIEVRFSTGIDRHWFGDEVTQSTARVRKLRVHPGSATLDTRTVKRIVTILPSLERVWLHVSDGVSSPFTPLPELNSLQALLEVTGVLASLKCLKHLCISLSSCEVWVYYVNAIATRLREANSCFSFLEIRELSATKWKRTVSIWNEVLGVFRLQVLPLD